MTGRDVILAELMTAGIRRSTAEVIADAMIDRLTREGLAIYKKKVAQQRRRPNTSTPLDSTIRAHIASDFALNPGVTQAQLAAKYNVNIGRVNEIVNA